MNLTRHCNNCGEPWTLDGQPGRGEVCMKCRADLRVCLNCAHYDPRIAQQCRERRAEPVLEKAVGNFCEYFDFARRNWTQKSETNKREAVARDQLKKLLGD
jgi:ribosome-binding protein aMBF1 (putative translation factor)